MSKYIFAYGLRLQEDGRIEVFPAAELFVLGKNGRGLRTVFHLDSGATTSIMPSADAETLGIDVANGKKFIVRGVSGESMLGYRHMVKIQLDGMKIKVPIIFVENASSPRIFGRESVFSKFGILFDELKRRTAFLGLHNRKTIDEIFK
ncbi:MAG: retropepsin-like domain-containing protein [Candidatus Sungbacteria bacterium]|nr:retropepsin-like domain-containing protein [Candidatus Sungbacteria bacterium]